VSALVFAARWHGLRRPLRGLLLALLAESCLAAAAGAEVRRVSLEPGVYAVLAHAESLFLEAAPRPGEGVIRFAERLCGNRSFAPAIAEANGGSRRLKKGLRYRVPFELLSAENQLRVVLALFRSDRAEAEGWRHRPVAGESLWNVSRWFTGRGENFASLRAANGLADDELAPGRPIVIPAEILAAAFRSQLPERTAQLTVTRPQPGEGGSIVVTNVGEGVSTDSLSQPPAAVPAALAPMARASAEVAPVQPVGVGAPGTGAAPAPKPNRGWNGPLRFERDAEGEVAVYPLRPGEALYSGVVVRFTGRLYAEDVNALAQRIAARSGIADVTDIPIGYPVKIPLDLVQPEFLPADHPLRREYEASLLESEAFRNRVTAADLKGITVVLDAGHGGSDVGAMVGGVRESLYVYDIMVRAKRLLDRYTSAKVVATTRDGDEHRLDDGDTLKVSVGHSVLTTPPYAIRDSKIGVHLRWALANSVYGRAVRASADDERVVFLSIHADSLHPSLRGAMAYIPDAEMGSRRAALAGAEYALRREVKEQPRGNPTRRQMQQSEGLSRQLARSIIGSFEQAGLEVHPFKPVRERIVRGRHPWVPAVLRYNDIPAKTLLEVCNLANAEDRALIQTRAFRQKVAEAIVSGVLSYYGPARSGSGAAVVAGRR